nr:6249_t:CDS:2 [Entrophospora candida]
MSSENLYIKIVEYLTNLKTEHIMAASVIYQGLEDNPWINKDELRASQVISDESSIVEHLPEKLQKKFKKLVEDMVPSTFPSKSDEKLTEVAMKILDVLKSIWYNPAFSPEYFFCHN